jgi:hypothetical protein
MAGNIIVDVIKFDQYAGEKSASAMRIQECPARLSMQPVKDTKWLWAS